LILKKLLASEFNGITVAEKLIEQTGVIGEKLEIRTFEIRRCFRWILHPLWNKKSLH
jgi:translation elongation factor EF-Ts